MLKIFAESESCSSDSSEEEKNSRLAFPDHTEKRLQVSSFSGSHTEGEAGGSQTRFSGSQGDEVSHG